MQLLFLIPKINKNSSKQSSRHTVPSLKDRNKFKYYQQVHLIWVNTGILLTQMLINKSKKMDMYNRK